MSTARLKAESKRRVALEGRIKALADRWKSRRDPDMVHCGNMLIAELHELSINHPLPDPPAPKMRKRWQKWVPKEGAIIPANAERFLNKTWDKQRFCSDPITADFAQFCRLHDIRFRIPANPET